MDLVKKEASHIYRSGNVSLNGKWTKTLMYFVVSINFFVYWHVGK
jgi:hypothetical protein